MTDNEIIKALECCAVEDCDSCQIKEHNSACVDVLLWRVCDLIKRQKEEIEVLAETLKATIAGQETLQRYIAVARAESVNEFAALLVSKAKSTKERFLLESLVESVKREMECDGV